MINFYLQPEQEALCLSIGYHETLYSSLYPDSLLKGNDYIFVTKRKKFPTELELYFEDIEYLNILQTLRGNEIVSRFSLWIVKNYQGKDKF